MLKYLFFLGAVGPDLLNNVGLLRFTKIIEINLSADE